MPRTLPTLIGTHHITSVPSVSKRPKSTFALPVREERFFPLCEHCALSQYDNGRPEGCECGNKTSLVKCFGCRNNELEICVDRRDAELRSRMSANLTGELIMKCVCGKDVPRGGNIFRCAGCTRAVVQARELTWDNLQKVYRRLCWACPSNWRRPIRRRMAYGCFYEQPNLIGSKNGSLSGSVVLYLFISVLIHSTGSYVAMPCDMRSE